ncbi:hypothetical protein Glove_136g64 [Diversispora epigaea]|uniref:Uncharacterized protein n=1 Tax=Diversispora epigaea TaxID=1348612 RepID=A0A397IWK0_9GLOM|nr:hypothetical protein Glove_136g64 [Diversispora epigaea]
MLGGSIGEWDQQWKRYGNREMEIHLETLTEHASIRFYRITQDPETHTYESFRLCKRWKSSRKLILIALIGYKN